MIDIYDRDGVVSLFPLAHEMWVMCICVEGGEEGVLMFVTDINN